MLTLHFTKKQARSGPEVHSQPQITQLSRSPCFFPQVPSELHVPQTAVHWNWRGLGWQTEVSLSLLTLLSLEEASVPLSLDT